MRRDRSPFSVLLNERIRENYVRGERAAQETPCLHRAADHDRGITVKAHLYVGKFYRVQLQVSRF